MEELVQQDFKRCENCRFFEPFMHQIDDTVIASDYGECRRFPPKHVPAEDQAFPIVSEDLWCGEFDSY